jgi:tetratricopeptide (TPR) repeat protein
MLNRNRTQSTLVPGLLLVVFTLALYSPVRNYPFVNYDDKNYVTENPHVQAGLSWKTFTWAMTANDAANWHPLTWLSHAADCQLYGVNAGGHHITSLGFHICNVLLLFLLLFRVTGARGRSFAVSALFALHPFNVESVAWVAERKNVLSTLLFLLAIGAYGWYASKPDLRRYSVVALLFALGLAAKPMVITFPFVLLLLDFWPLKRIQANNEPMLPASTGRKRKEQLAGGDAPVLPVSRAPFARLVLEKVPLLLLCIASGALTVVAQRSGGAIRSFNRIPLAVRLQNAVWSYAMYFWKACWPSAFALYYPHPLTRLAAWRLGLAAGFLVSVSALVWHQRRNRPYFMTGWLWYLGTLVPVIGIVQVGDQAMADRYAYVPLIGIFVMIVWAAGDWADRRQISLPFRAAAAVIVLASLSFITFRQIGYWRSSYDVWAHTLEVTGPNPLAESDLGDALHALGRPEDALPHFQNAVRMQPTDPVRRIDLAEDLAECERLQDAIAEYEAGIQLTSDPEKQARSYQSLAILHGELGEYPKVRESYHEALRIDPPLGEEMIRNLSRSFAANPSGGAYLSLGMLLEAAGRLAEARLAYQQALKLDPTLAEARQSLDAIERRNR